MMTRPRKYRRILQILERVWILSDRDDAAGDDGLDLQGTRARDQRFAVGARVEPDFRNLLPRDLLDDALADVRRHVHRRHVDGAGHIEDRGVSLEALDLGLVRIDWNDRVALLLEGPHGTIAELLTIARRPDDGDDLGHG